MLFTAHGFDGKVLGETSGTFGQSRLTQADGILDSSPNHDFLRVFFKCDSAQVEWNNFKVSGFSKRRVLVVWWMYGKLLVLFSSLTTAVLLFFHLHLSRNNMCGDAVLRCSNVALLKTERRVEGVGLSDSVRRANEAIVSCISCVEAFRLFPLHRYHHSHFHNLSK